MLVFDLGNVLLPFDWQRSIGALHEYGYNIPRAVEKVINAGVMVLYEKGEITTAEFYRRVIEALGVDISLPDFKRLFSDIFTTNDEVIDLLPRLRERYKLFLLSNTCEMHIQWIREQFPVLEEFDELILSYQVGHVKPEREIFDRVLKRSALPAKEHLYIDDIKEYTTVAAGMGLQAHHFQSPAGLIKELEMRGIIASPLS